MTYRFDPELAGSVALIPPFDFSDIDAARRATEPLIDAMVGSIDRTGVDLVLATATASDHSDHDVAVRINRPTGDHGGLPAIIDIHGGGFAAGDARDNDARNVFLARDVGAVVVSVDYRRAPEHPYPAALEDCYSVLTWLAAHSSELGVDIDRIAVGGGSAGGGLAAGLTLLTRDRRGPRLAFQYLGEPEVDDRLQTPSMRAYTETPFWNRPNAIISWKYYLGDLHGSGDIPIHAAPARATVEQLADLPPAYVEVSQFDPLRDEGIQYAANLAQAGVPTELHMFPGTFHGSIFVDGADVSQRQNEELANAFRRGLARIDS